MENQVSWKAFADGDLDARDTLLLENLGLVHHVARQLGRKLNNELDHDELVSAGTLGLMAAMTSFDANRGLAFSTFAVPRIRGAMLDELRRHDPAPRSVRRKTRDIAAARKSLAAKLCRQPDSAEVADALGVDVKTLWKWESRVEGAVRIPIDRPMNDHGESHSSPLELLHTDPSEAIDEQMGRGEEVAMLRESIMKLKEQERTVLALYYFEEMNLREIAEILSITESRVSQIRAKALARLRATMGLALAS
jgi:RNA polymerase sigma factor for flagellar operon FliA